MRRAPFLSDQRGAAAVEMALVLPLVLGLIFGTVEIGLVGLASNTLDNSLQAAARKIRVGESDAPQSAADFKAAVCGGMFGSLATCEANLAVSVRKFPSFAQAETAAGDPPDNTFDAGSAGDVIFVKATLQWPFYFPFYALNYQQSGMTTLVLDSRTTFKNEPYS